MDFGRTFTYMFEDKQWINKSVVTVLMVFLSIIPILGLVAVCALLGYLTQLSKNVQNGHPRPLPQWVNYGDKIMLGAYVLLAMIIYNLPVIFLSVMLYTFSSVIGVSLFGGFTYVAITFCALPLILIYIVITWSMLAVGLNRYSETGDNGVFYQFGKLFRSVQQNASLTLQYVLYSIGCHFLLSLIGAIPCIGWIAVPALYIPVQGYLIGEYGRRIEASERAFRQGR